MTDMGEQRPGLPDDETLLRELRAALAGTREVAEAVAARGKASFGWRTIDADLLFAELTFDSELEGAGSTTRARDSGPRILEFTAAIEIHVFADHVQGRIDPAGQVVVEWATGEVADAQMGPLGSFTVRPVPTGVFRLRSGPPAAAAPGPESGPGSDSGVGEQAAGSDGSGPDDRTVGRVTAATIVTDWITL